MALIYCNSCGHKISDKARFCPHCGAPVYIPQKSIVDNQHKSGTSPLLIGLSAVIFVLAGIVLFMLFGKEKENNKPSELDMLRTEVDSLHSIADKTREDRIATEDSLLQVEKERLEAERKAFEMRQQAEAGAAHLKNATGVYTGKIYGVRASMNLTQNGNYMSGTYTGNTRKYSVSGSIDDSNYFDLTIYNSDMAEAHISGYITGRKMSGTWEEYLTGAVYEFKLMR